ncbi:hypothetical protein D3C81_1785640 [compost metagenome]
MAVPLTPSKGSLPLSGTNTVSASASSNSQYPAPLTLRTNNWLSGAGPAANEQSTWTRQTSVAQSLSSSLSVIVMPVIVCRLHKACAEFNHGSTALSIFIPCLLWLFFCKG